MFDSTQSLDAELIDQLVAGERTRNALDSAQATRMLTYVDRARAAGERFGGARMGKLEASTAAHELSLALMLPVATVELHLARSRRVRATLPSVWKAWLAGEISTLKVAHIDQAAERLTQPDSIVALDESVVDVAAHKTPGQLKVWLARFVERTEADKAADRHERARKDRRVWISSAGDGMAWLTALIPELEAASIDQRLDSEARSLPSSDPRTHDQARADFLADLLLGSSGTAGSSGEAGCTAATIGVIVPIQSLMGLSDAPGELADRSASIPASLIRAKAVEPGTLFWRLLADEAGNLLDATSIGRYAPDKLGQAIRFRDGTSAFPTASVPADRCDIDHSEAWPAPTTAANLGPLHRRAHNLKTAGLLSMRQTEPGTYQWTTRTGHRYAHTSDPLPAAGWDHDTGFDPEFLHAAAAQLPPPEALAA